MERLNRGETVSADEISNLKEVQEGRRETDKLVQKLIAENPELANVPGDNVGTYLLNSDERKQLRNKIVAERLQEGSFSRIDKDGNEEYNGSVKRDKRLDIVIGLPASGKSSAIVRNLSKFYESAVIDSDIIKQRLPEYNGGWGATLVHRESSLVNVDLLDKSMALNNNIVLPIVGSKESSVKDYIDLANDYGYDINIHLNELPNGKAIGRMLNRYFEEGRFIDPTYAAEYGNKPTEVYERIKQRSDISGYSRWNNDVAKDKRPILREISDNNKLYGIYNGADRQSSKQADKRNKSETSSGKTQINDIAPTKASSEDGAFSNGKKQYSLSSDIAPVRSDIQDSNGRILSTEQREYFHLAKTRDEEGRLKPFYHGTGRADRVGNVFDPERATSGPMAYFTDNKEIADNYARDKKDTSIAYDSDYDSYETQFRVNRNGNDMSIVDLWNTLSMSERNAIKEKARLKAEIIELKYLDAGGLVKRSANGVETVLVNVDSKQAIYSVIGHETKHLLEKYGLNENFNKVLFEYAEVKGDLENARNRVKNVYKNQDVDIDSEVSADLVGKYLFEDEKFLDTLFKQRSDSKVQQVISKIKELIDDLVVRFKGTEQEKQLRAVQKKFIELYNSTDIVEGAIDKNSQTQYNLSRKNDYGDNINNFYRALNKEQWRDFYQQIADNGYLEYTDVGDIATVVIGNKLIVAERQMTGKDAHDFQVNDAYELVGTEDYDVLYDVQNELERRCILDGDKLTTDAIFGLFRDASQEGTLLRFNTNKLLFDNDFAEGQKSNNGTEINGIPGTKSNGQSVSVGNEQNIQGTKAGLNKSAFSNAQTPKTQTQFSLSKNDDIAPIRRGNFNITSEDVMLDVPIRSDLPTSNTPILPPTAEDIAAMTEDEAGAMLEEKTFP